ncbi:hypothetical protein, partial [Mesorhizobium sp.]
SSMTLHSFQGTLLSLQRAESVTHLSGMNCHPSLGKGSHGQGNWKPNFLLEYESAPSAEKRVHDLPF